MQIPHQLHVWESLPRNAMGKVSLSCGFCYLLCCRPVKDVWSGLYVSNDLSLLCTVISTSCTCFLCQSEFMIILVIILVEGIFIKAFSRERFKSDLFFVCMSLGFTWMRICFDTWGHDWNRWTRRSWRQFFWTPPLTIDSLSWIITEKEMLGEVNPLSPVLFLWLNCREKSR